jgi:hypothetical protein
MVMRRSSRHRPWSLLSSATTVVVVVVRGHAPTGVIGAVKRRASSSSTRSGIVFPVPWPLPLSAAQSGERGSGRWSCGDRRLQNWVGGLIVAEQVESLGLINCRK